MPPFGADPHSPNPLSPSLPPDLTGTEGWGVRGRVGGKLPPTHPVKAPQEDRLLMKQRRPHLLLAALALAALPAFAQEADPWTTLKNVRLSLVEAGPTGADFTQTFTAAGFSSGDKESGHLALSLPDCMRWDYTNPFPKSFLLCGGTVHAWNEGDPTGHRYRVDRKNEPGLDLLLLGVDELKSRYQASAKPVEGGKAERAHDPKTQQV